MLWQWEGENWREKKWKMVKSSLSALLLLLSPISGNRAPSILEHPLDMTVARWAPHLHFYMSPSQSLWNSCRHLHLEIGIIMGWDWNTICLLPIQFFFYQYNFHAPISQKWKMLLDICTNVLIFRVTVNCFHSFPICADLSDIQFSLQLLYSFFWCINESFIISMKVSVVSISFWKATLKKYQYLWPSDLLLQIIAKFAWMGWWPSVGVCYKKIWHKAQYRSCQTHSYQHWSDFNANILKILLSTLA